MRHLVLASLLVVGCGTKASPEPGPAATSPPPVSHGTSHGTSQGTSPSAPSGAASVMASSAASVELSPAPPAPAGPHLRRVAVGPMRPSIVVLGGTTAVLFHAGASKSLAVVDQAGGRVVPLDGKALTLEAVPKLASERVVRFCTELGGTPERLCAKLSYGVEPRDDPSAVHNAYEGHVLFALGPSGWKKEACWVEPPKRARARPRPPRELDDALLRAPVMRGAEALVWGDTGPTLLVSPGGLHLWKRPHWLPRLAEWATREGGEALARHRIEGGDALAGHRLESGHTLVVPGGYLVDLEGKVTRLSVLDEQGRAMSDVPHALVALGKVPLLVSHEGGAFLLVGGSGSPGPQAGLTLASPPTRTRATDVASPAAALGDPADFTPACSTPFVLLATSTNDPPRPDESPWPKLAEGLRARGYGFLQDEVTFVELRSQRGALHFGAQATSEKMASKLVRAIEQHASALSPKLTCLDALAKIPSRYSPPPDARIIPLNLSTGELIPLD